MPLIHPQDIPAAFGLLTRLPVPVKEALAVKRGAKAAWAWPIAGAVIGGSVGSVAVGLGALGLPLPLMALCALALQVILTGALHEDGLADTADGLWGGHDRARRLEIMKDSRIGAYGVIAIAVSLGIRGTGIFYLLAGPMPILALLAIGAISRLPMVLLMAAMPNARGTGLAQAVGKPGKKTSIIAGALTLVIAVTCLGTASIPVLFWVGGSCFLLALIAKRKIGGQTGDILGASQQIAEIAAILCLSALLQN